MIGQLVPAEIESLLKQQVIGRIGCHNSDFIYVVPISYAYDGKYIYCHTYGGTKIDLMRRNSQICFQVDEMNDMANWKSVIAWGEYEELTDEKERNNALHVLLKRELPGNTSTTTHLGETWPFSVKDTNGSYNIPGIVFRILLKEKTGKFENSSLSPSHMFN